MSHDARRDVLFARSSVGLSREPRKERHERARVKEKKNYFYTKDDKPASGAARTIMAMHACAIRDNEDTFRQFTARVACNDNITNPHVIVMHIQIGSY